MEQYAVHMPSESQLQPPPPDQPTLSGGRSAHSPGVDLEEVITTAELAYRPPRHPDYRAEAEALSDLAQAMARSPETMFQLLVDRALHLCGAQSAGISLLEKGDGQSVFRWRATAGAFAPLVGNTLPRDFSPCGAVLDRDALQLMKHPVRHYPYIADLPVEVHEVLLVPFRHKGEPIGTVWVVAHQASTWFDSEDARVVTSLAQFASAAWQALEARAEQQQTRTALAHATERAKWNNARFLAFFEQAPFYAGILSTDGRISEVGKMALEACGYTREEVLGKLFWETAWWRASAEIQAKIRAAFDTAMAGERYQANLPYWIADGTERWVDFRMSPVFDEKGAVTFLIATGMDITERVLAESRLSAVQKRLDSALIAAEIGTYEWDVRSDRLRGDGNFLRMFGVPVDETGGAPVASFMAALHPNDRERVAQSIQRSLATGENYEEDYRVLLPHGERWVNARGRMVKDAEGRVVSFFGLVIDITARKRAEQEREAIADRFRRLTAIHETVLSATNDFAYVFDLEGRFIYANRPLLALYNRNLEGVVGKTFSELGYPAWHAELHLREIAEVVATRQPLQGEVPFKGESGISGIYDYIFTPVFGADGRVEAVAGTTRDVSERKRGEDRDRLLIALDDTTRTLNDPHAITQASARLLGQHLQVNRCAYADVEDDENTFNLTGDYNHGVSSIVGQYRFDQFGEECLRLMRAGEPYLVSDAEADPNTATVREAYRATQIRSVICVPVHKSGRFVAAMAVHQTTPRTWLPGEVELLQRVASRCWESIERTRVIRVLAESEQRLRLAVSEQVRLREEADRASKAKDDFLATLSHELRTPLNPVLLLASDAVQDPDLPPEARASFEMIRQNIELEARLIDDLLDLTTIVRGKLAIKKEIRSVHAILNEAVAAVRSDFEAKAIMLEIKFGAKKHSVDADGVRLLQVFINLLKNAAKFTPQGGTATLSTALEDHGTIAVRLADTGIGLTPQELNRVFGAFEQGDHASDPTSRRFGGLGLGLAISQRLVEMHGGTIEAVSPGRDRGTTFTVKLPIHLRTGSDPRAESAPPLPPARDVSPQKGIRILLVEDHEPTRRTLDHLLRRRNYTVIAAGSLAEARKHAANQSFDLVISDVGLPDGDGTTLMSELRTRLGLSGIALTGYGMEEDITRCRAAGFFTHLTKPIRIEALEAALREFSTRVDRKV